MDRIRTYLLNRVRIVLLGTRAHISAVTHELIFNSMILHQRSLPLLGLERPFLGPCAFLIRRGMNGMIHA